MLNLKKGAVPRLPAEIGAAAAAVRLCSLSFRLCSFSWENCAMTLSTSSPALRIATLWALASA
jgi:TRAP-type C4-dicarboxylate transport system permease small subunit